MNSRPLVSIITPCFNGQPFLCEAIESVLTQDYPRIEYLVIDGGSTDGTLELLRSYGERVRWISEPDRGQSDALNKGFRMAKGEILAWVNADDLLLPGAVRHAVDAFVQDPQIAMVYGDGYILEENGERRCRYPYTEPFDLWRLIWYWDPILQQSTFFRADAVKAVGGINESLHWGLDWDLFVRLGKRFPIQKLEVEMGAIRDHPRAKTASGGFRRWRELAEISWRHSGGQITPASVMFGLDAYHKAISAHFGAADAGPIARFLGRGLLFAHGLAAHLLWPRLRDSQGWFEDGGAAKRLHLAFPRYEGEARLELSGSIPDGESGQSIEIEVNGTVICRKELGAGSFHVAESLPARFRAAEMIVVELRTAKVIGQRPGPDGHERRVCYRLDEARLVTSEHTFVCTPPQVFA